MKRKLLPLSRDNAENGEEKCEFPYELSDFTGHAPETKTPTMRLLARK